MSRIKIVLVISMLVMGTGICTGCGNMNSTTNRGENVEENDTSVTDNLKKAGDDVIDAGEDAVDGVKDAVDNTIDAGEDAVKND